MRFADADEPWPRPEGGPSSDDDLYRHGVSLSDPGGLDRDRAELLERERRRAADRERERAEQSERWLADRLERERKQTLELVVEMIEADSKSLADSILKETHKQLVDVRDGFRRELAAAGRRGDETVASLRQEMARTKAHEDGQLIDITPRKVKPGAA